MFRDPFEDIRQPGLRIDVVQLCRYDQRVYCRGALSSAVGTCEQPRLSAQGNPRSARSAALLLRQIRPSSTNLAKLVQRLSI
jgi:hypothetical protein